jgi:hypothetical protein
MEATLITVAGVVIAALLAFIAFLVKKDLNAVRQDTMRSIDTVRTDAIRKEELDTIRVSMESIVSSVNTLADAVKQIHQDVKDNYVRKESINGQLRLIDSKIANLNEKLQLMMNALNPRQ